MNAGGPLFDDAASLTALLTGAASGIGAATTLRLAAEGVARFVLVDRDAAGLEALAERPALRAASTLLLAQDVADEAAWERGAALARERFGRLDLAVACAGVAAGGAIADFPFSEWRSVLSANLDGVFLALRAAMRLMRGGRGAIVVVGSAAATKAEAGAGAYAASKAGALQLARVAAKEGAPDGIRVNALLPGGVRTPMWRDAAFFRSLVVEKGSEEAAFDALAREGTPLGRFAEPEEVAEAAVRLLSDRSGFVTGAALAIDGGWSL